MASDWKPVQIGDIAHRVTKGTTPTTVGGRFTDSGVGFVKVESITDGGQVDAKKLAFIDEETNKLLSRSMLQENDVLFTIAGTIGRAALVADGLLPANTNQAVAIIRPDQAKIDARFLYYALRDVERVRLARTRVVQSVQANFSLGELRSIEIALPPLDEQRAIAHILGTLDDKIELNRQMNRTVDEIARTLFTSWFVRFDPVRAKAEGRQPEGMDAETAALFPDRFVDSELGPVPAGWAVKTLGDIADNLRDNVSAVALNPQDNYVGLEHLPKRHIGLTEWVTAEDVTSNKSRFVEGDILFGKLRPYFHKVVVAPISGVCSTDILVIRPKECRYEAVVLCAASSDQIIALADSHSSGTRMPRAKWADLKQFTVTLPRNPAVLECFEAALRPAIRLVCHNVHENKTLVGLRDTLLPELLSGRVRVSEAKALVG